MSEKMKNIPKLRFPEFVNDGEWEDKKLGSKNISHSISSGKDKNDLNGTFNLYGSTGIIGQSLNDTYIGNFILVARVGANAGFLTKASGKFGVTDNTLVINLHEQVNIDFVFSLLEKFGLNRLIFGSGQPLITGKQIKELSLFFPKSKEQKKIADCLSSIDSLISAQIQKIELLKEHKKGLLQNLFPKDGESVPKYRFPEFVNDGEWEEKSLKEILIKNSMKNKNGKYSLVQSVSNKHGFINQDEYFENRRVASNNTSNYYVIKKGYFAYNPSRIDVGSLAYKFDDETSIISPLYVSFKTNKEKINDIFLLHWFFSERFTNQMIFEGGVRNTLNYENLTQIRIKLPQIEEQQKIANCLTSIDEEIDLQIKKVESLKEHKKALLQNLFPSNDKASI